jgi:very-short-patch-repair endonuclease
LGIRRRMEPWKLERAREMRKAPTAAERALWALVRAKQLGVVVGRQRLMLGYIVDFYCHSAKLVIEIDGEIHDGRRAYDAHRDRVLADAGFAVVRFTNEAVLRDPRAVASEIRALIGRAALVSLKKGSDFR